MSSPADDLGGSLPDQPADAPFPYNRSPWGSEGGDDLNSTDASDATSPQVPTSTRSQMQSVRREWADLAEQDSDHESPSELHSAIHGDDHGSDYDDDDDDDDDALPPPPPEDEE